MRPLVVAPPTFAKKMDHFGALVTMTFFRYPNRLSCIMLMELKRPMNNMETESSPGKRKAM